MKRIFKADKSELYNVLTFIEEQASSSVDERLLSKLNLVVEELFVNVANYAYKKEGLNVPKDEQIVVIDIYNDTDNKNLIISFEDNGVPFDPLQKKDPNMDEYIKERRIGGLGIPLVKRMMDKVYYSYEDNKNILVVEKTY